MQQRHVRQSRLVGVDGQARIEQASVEVPLDGFAGEVAARYLAGAGVGGLRVPTASLAAVVRAADARVAVEVAPGPDEVHEADRGALAVLDDPAAKALAQGALFALRALRAVLEGRDRS